MNHYSLAVNGTARFAANARFVENMERVPGSVRKTGHIHLAEGYFLTPPVPWEQRIDNGYPNVFFDEEFDEYRCYYTCFVRDDCCVSHTLEERRNAVYRETSTRVTAILLATSKDGIEWERPKLGCVEFGGNSDNNMVLYNVHGAGVFRDEHENDPARRYKMVIRNDACGKMAVSFSSDGIHWCDPINWKTYNPEGDTHNFVWWDESLGKYVLITRTWQDGVRLAARCESEDFMEWSKPEEIYRGDGQDDQIYSMPVFQKDGYYFGLASIFHGGDRMGKDFDCVDCELLYSSDTRHWNRICSGKPFIARTEGKYGDNVPDCGCIYASAPILRNGKYVFYYFGGNGQHTNFRETFLLSAKIDPDELAGFAPKDAGGGRLITAPVMFDGDTLLLKAGLSDGGRIEVCVSGPFGIHGQPCEIDGYRFSDSRLDVVGEDLYRATFAKPLSVLDKTARYCLIFRVRNAVLYSYGGDIHRV